MSRLDSDTEEQASKSHDEPCSESEADRGDACSDEASKASLTTPDAHRVPDDAPGGPAESEPASREAMPLSRLPSLSATAVADLRSRWIESLDELVAASATIEGRRHMQAALAMDDDAFEDLMWEAHELLGEQRFARLTRPVPDRPLGLLLEEDQQEGEAASDEEASTTGESDT